MKIQLKILIEILEMIIIGYGTLTIIGRCLTPEERTFLLAKPLDQLSTVWILILYMIISTSLVFLDENLNIK